MLLNWIFVFVGSLFVLIVAARYFTTAAEGAGQLLKLPAFVTGIFIVGIGTSLPELVTATFGAVGLCRYCGWQFDWL